MKQTLLIFTFLLTSMMASQAFAQACDLKKLEDEMELSYNATSTKLKNALAQNENASVDLSSYLANIDALRACQKKMTPKSVDMCSDYSQWIPKRLTSSFTLKRRFELFQSRTGKCLQNDLTMQYIITNKHDLQILYYQNGYYTMTHVVPAKSSQGPTGRTFLFTDGDRMGNAYAYVIDFPEPLDGHDLSLYWGATIPMNDRMSKLERILNGDYISFKWSNGAYVTIDSISEDIVASNFLAPSTYNSCVTDQGTAPSGRARMFPKIELLSGSENLVGTPFLNQ